VQRVYYTIAFSCGQALFYIFLPNILKAQEEPYCTECPS